MGNPPWVNWEYLSPRYRAGSQHLWGEYGLLQVKGPRLGFSKEDVSTLFTCAALDRFLVPGGRLSFILRQATFRSAQNGAGFRRFYLDGPGLDFPAGGPVTGRDDCFRSSLCTDGGHDRRSRPPG